MTPRLPYPSTIAPPGRLFTLFIGLAIVLLLAVSPDRLAMHGWQYGETGGSPLEKMHPGILLFAVLLAASAMSYGNPLTSVMSAAVAHPGLIVYFGGIALLIVHAVLWAGLPFTTFIDTFVGPALVFLLIERVPGSRGRTLAWLIHLFFAANALLGVAELLMGFRTTPIFIEGLEDDAEWRSSALLGHPLGNALLTGAYMVVIGAGGGRDLPGWLRPVLLLIAAGGMVAFGGRAATGFAILFFAYFAVRRFFALLAGAPFNRRALFVSLMLVPLLAFAVMLAAEAGFFDLFLSRLTDDEGSASTRVEMFELFGHLSAYDLVFGPDQAQIASLMGTYGLEYGIESFWVAMVLQHGFLVASVFFVTLFFFCREVVRAASPGAVPAFVYFFAVASTSVGLSVKSPAFAIFVLLPLLLLRRPWPAGAAEPAGALATPEPTFRPLQAV